MDRSQEISTLSVIIPTLNEANNLPLLLADLRAWPYKLDLNIVDGGSKDLTIPVAELLGDKVINSLKKNRGLQLKIGASNSKGCWLLFLHADCRLDKKWVKFLLKIIKESKSSKFVWYFNFKVIDKRIQFRFLEKAVAFRSHFLQRPYGDQGLLIHKSLYTLLGGFSSIELMEDLDFIERVTKIASLKCINLPLITNGRKWMDTNIIKRAFINARLRKKWKQGYSAKKISKEYYL